MSKLTKYFKKLTMIVGFFASVVSISAGLTAVASLNLLKRQFDVVEPNKVWVTDITYIPTKAAQYSSSDWRSFLKANNWLPD